MTQYKERREIIIFLESYMSLLFLHKHPRCLSVIIKYSPILLLLSLLAGHIPCHTLGGRQVQSNVSTLCRLCHLRPQTHFTSSPFWCQQLQTVSLGPAVSSGRQINTVYSVSFRHFSPSLDL